MRLITYISSLKLRSKLLIHVVLACALLMQFEGIAQNLEEIGQGEIFTLSGGLNVNQVFYAADGVEDRRDPYNYFLTGNLNFGIYGWSVPLSFSYSNQNAAFQQPFNQYGMSPTYKWVTAHVGYRSMSFSKYTLAGHLFLGVGFELAPTQNLKIATMYGRFQKAVEEDTVNVGNVPTYQRMGGGLKVTYGTSTNFIETTLFRASDDVNSLSVAPSSEEIKPQENLVLGLGFSASPYKGVSIKGEIASSAITTDLSAESTTAGNGFDGLTFLYQPRVSSSYYKALNGSAQYQFSKYAFGVAYERVDPGYQTLGAYYFNNDLENIALTHTSSWLDQKVSVNGRLGVQRNNLDNTELSTLNRFSTSVAVNCQISQKLTTAFNYSNFSTVVNFRSPITTLNQITPYDNLDTLNYQQISQNGTSSINYILNSSKERRQNVNFNFSYQQTNDLRAGKEEDSGSRFYNFNSAYSYSLTNLGLSFNFSGNVNVQQSATADSFIFGPSTSVRKSFLEKKVSSSLSFSYNNSKANGLLAARVTNLRLGGNYTAKEVHQFSVNMTAVNRFSPQNETAPRFKEFVAEVGYSYMFNVK